MHLKKERGIAAVIWSTAGANLATKMHLLVEELNKCMMTPKQQTLYAMMECEGYSYGCMQMVMSLLGASREALDDMILFIGDEHPSERELIAKLAELCE